MLKVPHITRSQLSWVSLQLMKDNCQQLVFLFTIPHHLFNVSNDTANFLSCISRKDDFRVAAHGDTLFSTLLRLSTCHINLYELQDRRCAAFYFAT